MTENNDAPKHYRLSKSKLAAFEHCPKRLWLQVHRRDAARYDQSTLARFRFGHAVGEKARLDYPRGTLVETGFDMAAALSMTAELVNLASPQVIFEGTFQHQNVLIRSDILEPMPGGRWHAIEVKGSSRVSSSSLADVATQIWVMRNSGLNIAQVSVRHLAGRAEWWKEDISTVRFRDANVASAIGRFVEQRPRVAAAAAETIGGSEPKREVGMHCYRPFACEFRDYCSNGQSTARN